MFHGVFAGFQLLIFKGLKKVSHIFVKYGALQHLKKPPPLSLSGIIKDLLTTITVFLKRMFKKDDAKNSG